MNKSIFGVFLNFIPNLIFGTPFIKKWLKIYWIYIVTNWRKLSSNDFGNKSGKMYILIKICLNIDLGYVPESRPAKVSVVAQLTYNTAAGRCSLMQPAARVAFYFPNAVHLPSWTNRRSFNTDGGTWFRNSNAKSNIMKKVDKYLDFQIVNYGCLILKLYQIIVDWIASGPSMGISFQAGIFLVRFKSEVILLTNVFLETF